MRQQEWRFSTARAQVYSLGGQTTIELIGVVTAQVYEALHLRMGMAPRPGAHILILGWPALLAVTNISAVDAAIRGTPNALLGGAEPVTILVPAARQRWAERHCLLMSQIGLCRRASVLPDLEQAMARAA